jgi:hypothetical protein
MPRLLRIAVSLGVATLVVSALPDIKRHIKISLV